METSVDALRRQLRVAVDECSARGLVFAAKWAAEQLCSLPTGPAEPAAASGAGAEELSETAGRWAQLDSEERDQLSLAKCLFDLREFERAAHGLQACRGPRAVFLRLYARLLGSERRKGEAGAAPAGGEADRELQAIRDELEAADAADDIDAFGLFLLAKTYRVLGQRGEARAACLRSVRQFEYNWSAWQLLESCVDAGRQPGERLALELAGTGWMRHAFMAQLLVEQAGAGDQDFAVHHRVLEQLLPHSRFVAGLRAVRRYSMREFEDAAQLFAQLQRSDPYALELSDIHSNILYVLEDRARLGALAHRCAELDRFRPETCCVIGNYYSLRREHEKAVGYFQRALQLDSKYLAAWTLMGHEFIEMKNTVAAVDAYRHAVEVDERDYRAWYGLGQTYELLNMAHYACSYYMRAAALRPYDSRMWCALGSCYESSGQRAQAVESYRRALLGTAESEAIAIARLARLHEDSGERPRAAYYYQLLVEHAIKNGGALAAAGDAGLAAGPAAHASAGSGGQQDELAAACLFLAAFEHDRGNAHVAQRYLAQIVDGASSGGASQLRVEEAKAMMRAITSE
ncbi:anaphase-promoting complex component apc8 [Coemansia spiralis]|nr:anaphase-promoting complex component apc8 [Coemansia spiralis]